MNNFLYRVYSCDEKMPPKPETPFKVYLVFAVVCLDGGTGSWEILQFSRDYNNWMPFCTRFGDPCIVTHWAELPPTPGEGEFGPRFNNELGKAI